ncbi:hypothetical protein Btru_005396 [Bulinus truncatus]|nr:hypothetical protein Btru_005396 [Bulinus truncatus]
MQFCRLSHGANVYEKPGFALLVVVAVFLSSFTLVAMCVDRYVAILRPLRPRLSKRAFLVTMITICFAIMMLQYFAPLAVLTVTNVHICYIVWIKKTPGEAERDRDMRMAASKRRLVKMIIIVVVIYAVCWLPIHVITLVGDHNEKIYDLPHMDVVWICAHWFAMSHSCYNPIVYFSLNATFRRNLKRITAMCRYKQKRLHRRFSLRTNKSDVWERDTEIYGSFESLQFKSNKESLKFSNRTVAQLIPLRNGKP